MVAAPIRAGFGRREGRPPAPSEVAPNRRTGAQCPAERSAQIRVVVVGDDDCRVGKERGVAEASTQLFTETGLETAKVDVGCEAADREQCIAPEGHCATDEGIDRAHPLATWRANGESKPGRKRGTNEVGLGWPVWI